ncbi:aliphatic amidase expression-regulating protein [Pusillimonas sp. T2]|uniref:substrate-binding protein n=1 Tax=Pusillimonas sp. T2 TaxID=1548123 RepID=UPI000B9D09FE|nr:substrate-binding protein [Pusillimonas sp. T2]OXR48746.1 aliphatic amidase expression-regulating protein [Pusillimonas sp. T2]
MSTKNNAVFNPRRRSLLLASAGMLGAGMAGMPQLAFAKETIKVGVLQPFSGGLEALGEQGGQAIRLALEEANASGGVLDGRMFEMIRADTKTDPKTAVERTNELIRRYRVNAIIGPVTSAERDAIRPLVERYKVPLLYATDYEGGTCSRYVTLYSSVPDQWVNSFIPYVAENVGKNLFLIGSDYVWPRKMNEAIDKVAAEKGAKVVATEYTPWGVKDYTSTLRKIESSGADVVVMSIVGADAVTFIKQFAAAGLKDKIKVAFFGFSENYLAGLTPGESEGIITVCNFTEALDKPEAKALVKKVRDKFGPNAIVSNTVDAHYTMTRFYIEAIKRANSDDKEAITDAIVGQTLMSGNGEVSLRASDRHADLNILIAQAQGGKMVVLKDIGLVKASQQCAA